MAFLRTAILRTGLRSMSTGLQGATVGPYALHKLTDGPSTSLDVNAEEAIDMLRQMIFIRRLETTANEEYRKKNIRGFLHLYSGQEACGVGIKSEMKPLDTIMTAYRCHGWAYLMGVTPLGVLGELMGRSAGCAGGKGGSMHLYAPKFYGGSGIVGGQVPVGAGIGFAHKYKGEDAVSVTLYGDGAANQGQVFEVYNMAKLWNLPVIFVCENNKFAMGTSQGKGSASPHYYTRGDYIPGIKVDGMKVLDVKSAFKYARNFALNNGPIVLELETYRYHGHSMSDPDTTYRTKDDIQNVRDQFDPINTFGHQLTEAGIINEAGIKAIEKEARELMRKALEESLASPFPADSELISHITKEKSTNVRGCDYWTRYGN